MARSPYLVVKRPSVVNKKRATYYISLWLPDKRQYTVMKSAGVVAGTLGRLIQRHGRLLLRPVPGSSPRNGLRPGLFRSLPENSKAKGILSTSEMESMFKQPWENEQIRLAV
ncbi:MAG: hypothetical protein LBC62_04435 [Treponema sp.]|jgi:Cft2 family RNA processing exonuclease|nr:hypothetical protein [Treponema sp.]